MPSLEPGKLILSSHKSLSVALVVAMLSGCSTHVALLNPTIPDPLVNPMPLVIAVRYPEKFEHYVHEEQVIGKDEWTIDLGRSNSMLFTKLFGAMFTDCTIIGSPGKTDEDEDEDEAVNKRLTGCKFVPPGTDPHSLPIDALIEPSIDAFEFSVPSQSQTDSFAVWIRYRIKVFDDEGNEIANWPISAYGKSLDTFMGSDEALRRAAVLAMRDAAALVILQMDKSTGISALSAARRNRMAAKPVPDGGALDGGLIDVIQIDETLPATATEDKHDDSG